jgi:hypothetical protein
MGEQEQILPDGAALISFRRAEGNVNLYGSSFDHRGFVRIEIAGAREFKTSTGTVRSIDRTKQYICVQMSFAQYAEAITSMNVGDGIPCTVARLMGNSVAPIPPEPDKIDDFKARGQKVVAESLQAIDRTIAAVGAQKVSTAIKNRILEPLYAARNRLTDSLPHIIECFDEELELLSQQARIEVEAYVDLALRSQGVQSNRLLQVDRDEPTRLDSVDSIDI